ncbi:Hypothetical protein HVR_LOCUS44 [uncultured virus]|nr:Hypothetical protein HVR_LOCUS44 [uncultured virus]
MSLSTELEHDAIKQMYQRLIVAHDKPIDFDDTIKRDIEGSRTFQEAFCCTDPIYKEQIEIIKAGNPNTAIDGTVGSYLYGCFQPELAVEIGCTPACADGINGLKNPDLANCEIASYEKSSYGSNKGKLIKLNKITSEDANLFMGSGESLTSNDKALLVQDGVKVITIYNQDENTINYVLGESIDVTQPDSPNADQPPPSSSSTTNGWVWFLGIVVIIVIILLLFFAFRS